jgi:hypothetical protein
MNAWLPCLHALSYMALAALSGYLLGRWREQLSLLEALKPET